MKETVKKDLVSYFMKKFKESGYTFTDEGQKAWDESIVEEQVQFIRALAFENDNKIAANTLLKFAQNLQERMELHPLFHMTRQYTELVYLFNTEKISDQLDNVVTEIEEFGGQFLSEPTQSSFDTFLSVGFQNQFLAWDFHRNYRQSHFFKYTQEYEEDALETKFSELVNSGEFVWSYDNVKDYLHSSGFSISRGFPSEWVYLTALLRTGLVEVRVEECPIPDKPEGNREDFFRENYLRAVTSTRGREERGYLAYCAWYWLYQKGGAEDIRFPTSICNVESESRKICIKIGDADPSQVTDYIFANNDTYVHMPYFSTPTLIIFTPNARFESYKNGDQKLRKLVRDEQENVVRLEKERMKTERQKELQRKYDLCQLKNHNEQAIFSTGQVSDILSKDETSPLKGQYITNDKVRNWIVSGKLVGFKEDKKWKVRTEDLLDFMKREKEK